MAIEAIKGAGMVYQGSTSTAQNTARPTEECITMSFSAAD